MKTINKLYKYVLLLGLVFIASSCTDESKFQNPVTHDLDKGAYARFTEPMPQSFRPEEAQSVSINAEIFDPNGNLAQYDLSVTAEIVSTGQVFTVENFKSFTSFPANLTFTSQDLADAFGIDISTFGAGDLFNFEAVTTRNDGVKFYGQQPTFDSDTQTIGLGNTQGNLFGPAYNNAMAFSYIIACPMPSDYFVGTYAIEVISNTQLGPIFGTDAVVEFEEKNVYQRTMNVNYLADLGIGQANIDFELTFLCGNVYVTDGQPTNLACGGSILLSSGGETPYNDGTFDDDSELIITVLEDYPLGSACGGDGITVLKFTKQ